MITLDCINNTQNNILKEDIMNTCKIEGCNSKVFGYGMCRNHYRKMLKWGDPLKRSKYDPNEIIVKGEYAVIIIYDINGFPIGESIIDVDDVPRVKDIKWGTNGAYIHGCRKGKIGFLHNFVMNNHNLEYQYDHINRNKWDNRKSNLRISNQTLNRFNCALNKNNTSGYKGVSKHGDKWVVRIKFENKYLNLGVYDDKKIAAIVYNNAAKAYAGEFAWLNPV